MKIKLIISKETIGILGFIPLGEKGITIFPIGWGFWLPSGGFYKIFNIREKGLALLDYIDHHPESPWHLMNELDK